MPEPEEVKTEVTTEPTEEKKEGDFQSTPLRDLFDFKSAEPSVEKDKVASLEEVKEEPIPKKEVLPKEGEIKTDDKKSDEKTPQNNWDIDDNPYKKKAAEFEKRYKDTQNWGFKAHQKLKEFGLEEDTTPEPTEEEKLRHVAFTEREKASYAAAVEIYGKDYVETQLYGENAPFKQIAENPSVKAMVMNADAPVIEALKIIKTREFFNKYGDDTEKVVGKIKKEFETELREKITKELQGKLSNKEIMPNTLTKVNSKDVKQSGEQFTPTPLSALFG